MTPRLLMTVSSAALAAAGVALLFLPDELQRLLLGTEVVPPLMLQLWAAGLLGLAATNWIGRGMTLGGVYGRALVLGNVAHWTVGGLSILGAALDQPSVGGLWAATAVYGAFTLAFAWLLRRDPVADLPSRRAAEPPSPRPPEPSRPT